MGPFIRGMNSLRDVSSIIQRMHRQMTNLQEQIGWEHIKHIVTASYLVTQSSVYSKDTPSNLSNECVIFSLIAR
jgi:hypothetical protein